MTEIASRAESLAEKFDVSPDTVQDEMETYAENYQVPIDLAEDAVERSLRDQAGLEPNDPVPPQGDEFDQTPLDEINTEGAFVDIIVEFVDEWEKSHSSMTQVGKLGDENGTIKFTAWEDADEVPTLEEGKTYRISDAVVTYFEGNDRYSVKLQNFTEIQEADTDVEVQDNASNEVFIEGLLADVDDGSGLIKRCTNEDCNRALNSGACPEHGNVEGEHDIRLKTVVDNGNTAERVVFGTEATAEATGIDLADAKDIAKDALDSEVVAEEMEEEVLGGYYQIDGADLGSNVVVNEFEALGSLQQEEQEALESLDIVAEEAAGNDNE
jgi:replication factor A1